MRIPVTINPNILKTYGRHNNDRTLPNELQSDNLFDWDRTLPKSLQEACIETIANNWETNPVLEEIIVTIDRCLLLNILSTELPLTLTVPKINDDIYWKRCYLERWPKSIPENVPDDFQFGEIVKSSRKSSYCSNGGSAVRSRKSSSTLEQLEGHTRTWKECFLESHIRDFLEKVNPEDYDAEQIKELSDLGWKYVKKLELRELQSSKNSCSRIPLNAIVTGLQNLTELSICFKQTYVGEEFTWDILKVSIQDIKLLAKGLEKCKLKVFRLSNSDIDDEKAIIVLKSLLKHEGLETVDFSHCRISDYCAVALSNFCLQNPVSSIYLTNNSVGPKGVEALCYAICQSGCNVKTLDVKLNPIRDEGANFLMIPLTMGARNIKHLYLNGCRLRHIPSIGEMIEHNSSLRHLDLSNNSLGEEIGKIILQGLRYNTTLQKLDVRMCQLRPDDEFEILQRIAKNKKALKSPRSLKRPIIIEPRYNFNIPEDLLSEIENVFGSPETSESP